MLVFSTKYKLLASSLLILTNCPFHLSFSYCFASFSINSCIPASSANFIKVNLSYISVHTAASQNIVSLVFSCKSIFGLLPISLPIHHLIKADSLQSQFFTFTTLSMDRKKNPVILFYVGTISNGT